MLPGSMNLPQASPIFVASAWHKTLLPVALSTAAHELRKMQKNERETRMALFMKKM